MRTVLRSLGCTVEDAEPDLTDADEAHITCPRGSDLRLDLTGRAGIADDGSLLVDTDAGRVALGVGEVVAVRDLPAGATA